MNELIYAGGNQLPALPLPSLFPLGSQRLQENKLILCHTPSVEQCVADLRARINPAQSQMRRIYTMEPDASKKNVTVKYWLDFEGKHRQVVGRTLNDEDAVRILIGNALSGAWMSSITWELYNGRTRDELVDMERTDQWGLLAPIDPDKFEFLKGKGIKPQGNWDFYRLLWRKKCHICGTPVAINMYAYNIDSGVCSKCNNRPWLAPSLHRYLDSVEGERDLFDNFEVSAHALAWMSDVGAQFNEVRKNKDDINGQRLRQIWGNSVMAKALNPATESEVESLLERSTTCHITMFRDMCKKLEQVFTGEAPFTAEHKLVAQFVFGMIELMQKKRLSTSAE